MVRQFHLVLVLFVAAAGCYEATLDTCAGLACPDGRVCRIGANGPSCPPIAGCDRHANGTSCDVGTGQEAFCDGGACVATERCGNGIVESTESCDCGELQQPQRPECNQRSNSDDDPLAPCRLNCTLRTCGDGIRDGTEQCEGETIAPDLTCSTFGYYEGDLTCSSLCIVDTVGCMGKCGDGVVDADREFCDPMVAQTTVPTCTDFGYATGVLGCNALCGPSFENCRDGTAAVELLPLTTILDLVRGPSPTEAWVALTDRIVRYTSRGFVSYPTLASRMLDISSHGVRAAVALADSSVVIYEASGVVETLTAPAPCRQVVMTGPSTIACLGATAVYWWNGTSWGAPLAAPAASDAIAHADGSVIFTQYNGTMEVPRQELLRATSSAVTSMGGWTRFVENLDYLPEGEAPTPAGYYGGLAYGGVDYGLVRYNEQSLVWEKVLGTQTVRAVAHVGGRTMWAMNGSESVRLPNNQMATLDVVARECVRFVSVGVGSLCLTRWNRALWRFSGATIGTVVPLSIAAGAVVDVTVDDNDKIYAISSTGAGASSPAGWSSPDPKFRVLVGARGGKVAMMTLEGTSGEIIYGQPGAWVTQTWPLPITAATLGITDHVVYSVDTVGACGIKDWNTVDDTVVDLEPLICPDALWVSPTNHVWASDRFGVRDATLATQVLTIQPSTFATRSALSGTDDNHVWYASSGQIWFWNGQTWAKQLDVPTEQFDWIHASASGVIATGSGSAGRTTWILSRAQTSPTWMKLRLPGDLTPMIEPQLRPWGVVYRTGAGTANLAAWQDGWVE